jgi:predicted enzyme related to lactoylglutathione lyase
MTSVEVHLAHRTHTYQFQNRANNIQVGAISWIEIPVTDISRAINFYTQVFGWSCSNPPAPSTPRAMRKYVIFQKGSTQGCFVEVPRPEYHLSPIKTGVEGQEQKQYLTPRFTVTVENVDETIQAIEKAGGSVWEPKKEIPGNMGYAAWCLDTEGNMCGIWAYQAKKEHVA